MFHLLPMYFLRYQTIATLLKTLDLEVSEDPFQDLRTLAVSAAGDDSQPGFVFSKCSHHLRAHLSKLQPLAFATAVASSSAPTSIQGRSVFTVEEANLALTTAYDTSAAGDPIEFAYEFRSDAVDFRLSPLHLQLS
jgi:hypothetical protein